ncbi:1-deoxy-D-xylulose-5-phosphate reductoisomerase [Alkaliphilus sp. MSJ-5]|uniref:1-deoxy-D-xylulose 5-phosphate reductoisomerase n=1 Tax=Alkaliphilus flagellatus TaxID=2841507 RepID=A0ABS6G4Q2_9FIRM|nr:1-deoxy-D-xylulose-5-phosphate reductoisomerase [Alkaliphilus flagellatus]MBU5677452.1 1-deoxy-D-xylulose-5-phosphate reductoisomerase [Alkaliphilus flagellatus]
MKNISILGSTGSIGKQTLDVVKNHRERFKVVGLSALENIDEVEKQIYEFDPEIVAIFNQDKAEILSNRVGRKIKIVSGIDGLIEVATLNSANIVVTSVVGSIGLIPTLEAIRCNKTIALANKETLVVAGELVMNEAQKYGVEIIPVDSEHSAIFQCLQGEDIKNISRIILTASGGSFRDWTKEEIEKASAEDALRHPTWNMGQKVTIDSATLMNKGLEVIEARWLFNLELDKIDVIVHPQSIIHSMVEYKDNSIISQMGLPDMRTPIQYALSYPERINSNVEKLDFNKLEELTFMAPDTNRFPCLSLAYEALKIGKTMPCVLNGANEVLVEYFLKNKIRFYDIPELIEKAMSVHEPFSYKTVDELLEVDKWVRSWIKNQLK